MDRTSTAVLIPARWASSRLPEKMMRAIAGKPLIQWTYERALEAFSAESIWILTDHGDIYKHAKKIGAQVIMTPEACENGSSRMQWALQNDLKHLSSSIILGLQGDEPLLPAQAMHATLNALLSQEDAVMSTLTTPIEPSDFENPSVVKCVHDLQGRALYFSRSPIPNPGWHKNRKEAPACTKRHIGLYIWRRSFLEKHFNHLPASGLQMAEDLEQLKILEAGYRIQVANWPHLLPPGVDNEEDLRRVESLLLSGKR